jgi:Lon protease-like protein
MKTVQIPLFPLNTVLFPGGPLPLRIFEARYMDMVSNCLKTESGFGVCLIRDGKEVGEAASTYGMGTIARIVDWHTRHDGLLGISAIGEQRFRIASVKVMSNKLSMARVEVLPDQTIVELPDQYLALVDMLRRLVDHAGHQYAEIETHFADAGWVSYRLAEMLPLRLDLKQHLLEMEDPIDRLEWLFQMLQGMEVR